MNKNVIIGGAAVAVVAILAGGYFWLRSKPAEVERVAPAPVASTAEPDDYPVPESAAEQRASLPELAESDAPILDALKNLFSTATLTQYLIPRDIVRHVVVTVDNLPRKKIAERLKPVTPIPGKFMVSGNDDAGTIDADNAARYRELVRMVSAADMQKVADVYFRFYPLMQKSYTDLGYPSGYFNDRLVEVIDHLLATPDISGPIALTRPGVMYEYADPKLEDLSAGQKAMLRIGGENAAAIKTKLRELRAAIANKQKAN